MKEIAIKVSNLKKKYQLGAIGGTTLQRELQSWWAKKSGKEDPNLKLGLDERLIGQDFWSLAGIDLTIYKGERLGIIGNNGAGKSTLLKLICSLTAPSEGEIDLYGKVTSLLEVGTGFHGEMTGRENIYLNGAILGMSKKEIDDKMEQIIDFSEIKDFIDTPVKRYSSGMFVKLAFAVAAHLNSEIMIMDEVLAVGDLTFQQKCLASMEKAAKEEHKTILYVSHNMETIRQLCSRCIVLDEGKIIFDGEVEAAIACYMDHSLKENQVELDFETNKSRIDRGLKIEHLSLENKVIPSYTSEEDLRLKIRIKVSLPNKELCFRLTLRDKDDVGIGTSYSKTFKLKEGTYEKTFIMPLSMLAKGVFYGSIGFYTVDELGRKKVLEHLTRAFKIEIKGKPIWNTRAHGYIELPEMQMEQ